MTRAAGVDLGKTGCRVLLLDHGDRREVLEGPGAPGLAEPGGVEAAVRAIGGLLPPAPTGLDVLAVAAAGAEAAPAQAEELARRLLTRHRQLSGVAVTSDSVAAHCGALGGAPGVVLAAGTGTVALGLSADGVLAQLDGWGPWLGDDGGGAWLGREGLRAVLSAREGRGPGTDLAELARARFGDLSALPRVLASDGSVASATATFAPDVISAAEAGDAVAAGIVDRAAHAWADLVAAAADRSGQSRVAVVGGLASVPALAARFDTMLRDGLERVAPEGAAVDGAALLARRRDLPHEARVLRLRPDGDSVDGGSRRGPRTAADVDGLATEQARPDLADLDVRDPAELVATLLVAEAAVPEAVARAADELAEAVRMGADALSRGGRIVYVGAGTPGRLAALDAAECPPTFGTTSDRVVAVLAGGGDAEARAVEGAEDDRAAGEQDLLALRLEPRDLVIGISASGRTPYVLSALATAREQGCRTVAVVNNPDSSAREYADTTVELLTGPEVVAGSTRLKAGTAQKVALNVISTGAMVRNGKTYGAWMVDVTASNEKLRRRARRILREAAGVDDDEAVAILAKAGWRTKTALVATLAGVDTREAQVLLDRHGGRVRAALAAAGDGSEEPER